MTATIAAGMAPRAISIARSTLIGFAPGDRVDCGGVLYRVDDRPVVLLCGTIPAYRALHLGVKGRDVRQLNRNLHQLGYDADAHVRIDGGENLFTSRTEQAPSGTFAARSSRACASMSPYRWR